MIPLKSIIQEFEEIKKEITTSSKTQKNSEISGSTQVAVKKEIQASSDSLTQEKIIPSGRIDEKEIFSKIIESLQKEKSSLAAILNQHSSFKLKDEVLEISFSGGKKFYMNTLQKEIKLIGKVASDVIGKKINVKLTEEVVDEGTRREKEVEAALKDPNIQYFMDLFKAQVISVEPIKRAKDRE